MALKIRLRQQGRTNRQTYRLVVTDVRNPRDGKYLEMLGWYSPFSEDEKQHHVDAERVQHWLSQGAALSPNVESLLMRISPEIVRNLRAKKQTLRVKKAAKRVRRAAKRRALKKG